MSLSLHPIRILLPRSMRTSSTHITLKNINPPPPPLNNNNNNNSPDPSGTEDNAKLEEISFDLTTEEIAQVTSSAFLSGIHVANPRDHLPEHVKALAPYIPMENGFLKQAKFPDSPTPFQMYTSPNNTSEHTSTRNISQFPRLSVTKLLTQSWCELRYYYETYSQLEVVETEAMKRGKETHLDLELSEHPPIDMSLIQVAIPQVEMTKEDAFADAMRENVLRLTQLLIHGSAREIYVHGYINEEEGVVQGHSPSANDTIVTGIVDLLVLRCRDRNHPLQRELNQRALDGIDSLISCAETIVPKYKDQYIMGVCDVKTRRWRKVPTQSSVVEGSKQQVMIYDALIRAMGETSERSIEFWEQYCLRKGVDIDSPVSAELALSWICLDDLLLDDFRRLRDGSRLHGSINWGDVDQKISCYDLTNKRDKIQDEEILKQVGPFLQPWSMALTPRYFINRLSQLFHLIAQIPRGDLSIQYYCNGEIFKVLRFHTDPTLVDTVVKDALSFWMGKRAPKTMEKTYSNMRSKCNFCEFADSCGWRRDTEERFGDRGQAYRSS